MRDLHALTSDVNLPRNLSQEISNDDANHPSIAYLKVLLDRLKIPLQ